jgi:hypothetical protein
MPGRPNCAIPRSEPGLAPILAVSTLDPYGRTYTLWYSAPALIGRRRSQGFVAGGQGFVRVGSRLPRLEGFEFGKPEERLRGSRPERPTAGIRTVGTLGAVGKRRGIGSQ